MSAIASRVAWVADAMCGTTSRLGAPCSGSPAGSGSGSVTSSAAPAIQPSVAALAPAPRVDDRAARSVHQVSSGLHRSSTSSSIRPRVSVVSGLCRLTTSASASAPRAGRPARPLTTRPPNPSTLRATARPMRPADNATVERCRSRPSSSCGPRRPTRRAPRRPLPRRAGACREHQATARSAVALGQHPGVLPHGYAALGGRREVDVVHAHRVVRDRPQPRRRPAARRRSDPSAAPAAPRSGPPGRAARRGQQAAGPHATA